MTKEFANDDKSKVNAKLAHKVEPAKEYTESSVTTGSKGKLDAATLTQMQQTVGNTAVQRFLVQRSGTGPTEIDDETAASITNEKGSGGQALDDTIAAKAGGTMGQDFSDVRVHTGGESDQLNQTLGAKAFTTGNDIFFRDGAYAPSSSDGQRLIAHELTHVAQQKSSVQQGDSTPSVQGKMTVNDPNDKYEAEADSVADQVMNQSVPVAVQQQEMLEDEVAQKPADVQQETLEEEDMAQQMPDTQRQEMEEELE